MFEKFTADSRFCIFYARYIATTLGSLYVEPEHLLLSLLCKTSLNYKNKEEKIKLPIERFLPQGETTDTLRQKLDGMLIKKEPISSSTDLPLSHEIKLILSFVLAYVTTNNKKAIYQEYLLYGILKHNSSMASRFLVESGVNLKVIEEYIATLQ